MTLYYQFLHNNDSEVIRCISWLGIYTTVLKDQFAALPGRAGGPSRSLTDCRCIVIFHKKMTVCHWQLATGMPGKAGVVQTQQNFTEASTRLPMKRASRGLAFTARPCTGTHPAHPLADLGHTCNSTQFTTAIWPRSYLQLDTLPTCNLT